MSGAKEIAESLSDIEILDLLQYANLLHICTTFGYRCPKQASPVWDAVIESGITLEFMKGLYDLQTTEMCAKYHYTYCRYAGIVKPLEPWRGYEIQRKEIVSKHYGIDITVVHVDHMINFRTEMVVSLFKEKVNECSNLQKQQVQSGQESSPICSQDRDDY